MAERFRRRAADPLHWGSNPHPGSTGDNMGIRSSDIKEAIGDLIKVISALRRTSPDHRMSESQKEEIIKYLDSARSRLEKVREGIKS